MNGHIVVKITTVVIRMVMMIEYNGWLKLLFTIYYKSISREYCVEDLEKTS